MHKLDEIILHSHELQSRVKNQVQDTLSRWRSSEADAILQQCLERLKDIVVHFARVVHEKVLLHHYVEKAQSLARHAALRLYKRCYPYLLQIAENSTIAASLGFAVGALITYWTMSTYLHYHYNSIIKTRTMSGVTFEDNRYRGLESLSLKSNLIVPKITRPTQVLVRIHAASVDAADIAILSGVGRVERKMYSKKGDSILGRDFSGVVLDIGRKVKNVDVGDNVWSALPIASNGALCEFVVVESDIVSLRPAHLSHDGAATLPFACLKVWDAFVNQGGIRPFHGLRNKSILVVDGGSPTGCIAIQVAKAWEGHVTTCVHHRVTPLAKQLGADRVISLPHDPEKAERRCRDIFDEEDNYFDFCVITSEDSALSEHLCQDYANVVLKSCCSRHLASDGYGFFRRKVLQLWRSVWTSSYHRLDIKPLEHFKQLVEDGKLQPVLDSAYAYEQAEEAFHATATTSNIGKTIVTFGLRGYRDQSSSKK